MKKSLFLLAPAALMLMAGCAASPTQKAADALADASILINSDGAQLKNSGTNEVAYGKIFYAAITWQVKAANYDLEGDDGTPYAKATIKWEFDSHFVYDEEGGPDPAHAKVTQSSETKEALKAADAQPIAATAKATITFRDVTKIVNYSMKLLPKA